MTQQEKDEFNQRRQERLKKDNKGRIKWAIIIAAIGLVLTIIMGAAGKAKQGDIESATVLKDMSLEEFISENDNGAAIYTGAIYAVDPVTLKGESGSYIMFRRKVEQKTKEYNEDEDKYEYDTQTLSDRSKNCEKVEIDGVEVDYDDLHSIPKEEERFTDGADSNQMQTTYTYISDGLEGTFFIKVKDGKVSSAEYFSSEDVSAQSKAGFGMVIVMIWLIVIVAEIVFVVKFIKTNKIIKTVQ